MKKKYTTNVRPVSLTPFLTASMSRNFLQKLKMVESVFMMITSNDYEDELERN